MNHQTNAATLDRLASAIAALNRFQDEMAPDNEAEAVIAEQSEGLWDEFGNSALTSPIEALVSLASVARILSTIADHPGASSDMSRLAETAHKGLGAALLVLAKSLPQSDRATLAPLAERYFLPEIGERLHTAGRPDRC